jgi:hypothetical protein
MLSLAQDGRPQRAGLERLMFHGSGRPARMSQTRMSQTRMSQTRMSRNERNRTYAL